MPACVDLPLPSMPSKTIIKGCIKFSSIFKNLHQNPYLRYRYPHNQRYTHLHKKNHPFGCAFQTAGKTWQNRLKKQVSVYQLVLVFVWQR
jgi:hypothetical protein